MQTLEARASDTLAVLADRAKKTLRQLAVEGDGGLAEAERLLAMADEVSARAAGALADAGKLVERMVSFVSKVSAFLDILASAARAAAISGVTDGQGASNNNKMLADDKMLADMVCSLADKISEDLPGEHDDLIQTMQDLGTTMRGGGGGGAGDAVGAALPLSGGASAGLEGTVAEDAMGLGGLVRWVTQKLAQIEGRLREMKACLEKCEEPAKQMLQVGARSGLLLRRQKAVHATKRLLLLQLSLSAVIEGGRLGPCTPNHKPLNPNPKSSNP